MKEIPSLASTTMQHPSTQAGTWSGTSRSKARTEIVRQAQQPLHLAVGQPLPPGILRVGHRTAS
jgi:hypothetical protein